MANESASDKLKKMNDNTAPATSAGAGAPARVPWAKLCTALVYDSSMKGPRVDKQGNPYYMGQGMLEVNGQIVKVMITVRNSFRAGTLTVFVEQPPE